MSTASTKLTAPNGLIELVHRDTKNVSDYLIDIIYAKKSRKISDNYPHLTQYLPSDVVASIEADIDTLTTLPELANLVSYEIREPNRDYRYLVTIVLDKSSLAKARKIYKELLKTTSDLSKLSGKLYSRRNNTYCYDLIVDCNDSGKPSWGIHRLARLVVTLDKYLEQK